MADMKIGAYICKGCDLINKKFGKKYKMPVVYYSQLMAVAYGASAKEAGLDGNIVRATQLEEIAAKK